MQRAAPQFRQQAAGTRGLAANSEKIQDDSNCLRNLGGTPLAAASSCVVDFFCEFENVSNGKRLRCGAFVTEPLSNDGNQA